MDTTSKFSSESVGETSEEITVEGSGNVEDKGFFGMLAQSIFEVSQFEYVPTDNIARSQQRCGARHECVFLPTSNSPVRSSILNKLELPRPDDARRFSTVMGIHDLVRPFPWSVCVY